MKKLLFISVLAFTLTACAGKAETSDDKPESNQSSETTAASSPEYSDVVDCEWEYDGEAYTNIDDFVAYALDNMYYYDVFNQCDVPIVPYIVDYDEMRYDFVQVYRTNNNQYTYSFRDKQTNKSIMLDFFYYCGYETEPIANDSPILDLRTDLGSSADCVYRSDKSCSVIFYPEACCEAYLRFKIDDSESTNGINAADRSTSILNAMPDFSISKAEPSSVTESAEYSDVSDCEWVDNSETYDTVEQFLENGAEKMCYYDAETQERMPITPYTISYDENKYDFVQIYRSDEYEYAYILREADTNALVKVIFFYEGGLQTVNDIYQSEQRQKINVDFQGKTDVEALIQGTDSENSITVIPGENCQMTIKYSKNDDTAAQANMSDNSPEADAAGLIADFTISEA